MYKDEKKARDARRVEVGTSVPGELCAEAGVGWRATMDLHEQQTLWQQQQQQCIRV